MKIGIDARLYGTKHRGLGRYVKKLVDGMVKFDLDNQYVIFLTKDNFDEVKSTSPHIKKVLLDARWYSLKEQLIAPQIIKKENLDLIHFPHFNVPLYFNQKFIVTIHDLIIDEFPDSRATTLPNWKYKFKLKTYKKILKHTVSKAEKIIVPSGFVKDDLIKKYQVPSDKIFITYEGYFLDQDHGPMDISRFSINKPFLLYVGAAYPHKNLDRLVKVFNRLNKDKQYNLVLVGSNDYFYKRLKESVKKTKEIIFTGYVSESELSALYKQAEAYVFPSFYEGFGLPPIEAQAHGLPVVSSNRSCLPEILGGSALYFNPEDEKEMSEKISLILNNKDIREDLKIKGQENIKRFSWQKMVETTNKIYLS